MFSEFGPESWTLASDFFIRSNQCGNNPHYHTMSDPYEEYIIFIFTCRQHGIIYVIVILYDSIKTVLFVTKMIMFKKRGQFCKK